MSEKDREIVELRRHNATLERLLDAAYDRLHWAGLTEEIPFEVSEEAATFFEALPGVFSEAEAYRVGEDVPGGRERTKAHLDLFLRQKMVEAHPAGYVKTGYRPYF